MRMIIRAAELIEFDYVNAYRLFQRAVRLAFFELLAV